MIKAPQNKFSSICHGFPRPVPVCISQVEDGSHAESGEAKEQAVTSRTGKGKVFPSRDRYDI